MSRRAIWNQSLYQKTFNESFSLSRCRKSIFSFGFSVGFEGNNKYAKKV